MKRPALVVAAVVVALALAWFLFHRSHGGDESAATGKTAATPATLAPPSARGQMLGYQPASLAGEVHAASGQAVVGATVSLSRLGLDFGARSRPGASPEPPVTVTDQRGHFALGGLPPGRYSVSAVAPAHQPAVVEPVVLAPGEARTGVVLTLADGGSHLQGTVSDIGGGPVEGALVRVNRTSEMSIGAFFRAPFTTRTDEAGHYGLDLADGDYYVAVVHPDYVREDQGVELRGPRTLDITLTPGGTIEGVVKNKLDDAPVAGAMVTPSGLGSSGGFVLSGVSFGGAVSDQAGHFVLRSLKPGAIELRAVAPGAASASPTVVELGIAEQQTDVVVYVERAFSIAGTVVDKGKKTPVPGVLVGAYNLSPGAAFVASDPSGEDGSFVIHGVQPGAYMVGAAIDGRVPNFLAENVTISDQDIDDVVVELDAGASLSGRVEPPQVASVWVELDGEIGFGNMLQAASAMLVSGKSDETGAFSLRGVPSAKLVVKAEGDDGSSGTLPVEVKGDADGLLVTLEPRGLVAGVVVDESGAAVEGANVRVSPVDPDKGGGMRMSFRGGNRGGTESGADGRFEVRGLDDGDHEVTVSDGGQLAWGGMKGKEAREPRHVAVAAARPIRDLRLVVESRHEVIRGVVLQGGAPVADAWVTATHIPPDGESPWAGRPRRADGADDGDDQDEAKQREQMRRWYPSEDPVLTDETGHFEVKHLRHGSYDLKAEAPRGGGRGEVRGVASGATTTVELAEQAVLTGKVSKAGAPVSAYVVEVEGPTSRREQFGAADGVYRMSRLQPGSYKVLITSPAGRSSASIDLAAGDHKTLDFQLIAYGSVTGVVTDAQSGEPLAGLYVIATTEEQGDVGNMALDMFTGNGPKTDDDGRFRVDRLGAGKGTVMVMDDGGGFNMVAQKEFTLAAGQDLDLGTMEGVVAPKVPEDQRGTLGMKLRVAHWSSRPGAPGGDDPAPAGLDDKALYLFISEVVPGGPADSAGAQVGDRLVTIQGAPVDAIGVQIAQVMLDDKRVMAGVAVTLGVDRPGGQTTLTITATKQQP